MQLKPNEIDGFLKRPDPMIGSLLVYGPDRGLVGERAAAFAAVSGVDLADPFSVTRIDAADIDADPGRLLSELRTVALFAGKRIVWVRGASAQKELLEAIATVEAGEAEAILIIEAGDLKKSSALRTQAEGGRRTVAAPCYADDIRGLDALIDSVLSAEGMSIALDARAALRERLGGDRLASRGEIAKLVLYCGERRQIAHEDIDAVIGDASAQSTDGVIDAFLAGDPRKFDMAYARAVSAGVHPFVVLSAAIRQLQILALLRHVMDREGRSASAAVAAARPPVFFARRAAVENALQHMDEAAVARALDRLHQAVLATRRQAELAEEIARQALLGLALANRRRR